MFLTQEGGLLGPLAKIFGVIMNFIFEGMAKIGFVNVGLAIIIFTIITRIILYPFTAKQQKQSRMMSYIQPEIQAIQAKYQDKKDQASIMAMNQETKAVYEKYGTSMTGSCVQLLIQMPIIFALYRVIMKVPAYVSSVKDHYINIINAFGATTDAGVKNVAETIINFCQGNKALTTLLQRSGYLGYTVKDGVTALKDGVQVAQIKDRIIDFLYNLNPEQMSQIASKFAGATTNANYVESVKFLENSNFFLGMNLPTTPWDGFNMFQGKIIYLIIPILAGVTQYLTAKLMTKSNKKKDILKEESQVEKTMQSMNITMPLISVFFCFTFATGIGIYWIATSVLMVIQQLILNYQMDKVPVEEMIKQNIHKANEKRKKKGLPLLNEDVTVRQFVKAENKTENAEKEREELLKKQAINTEKAESYYFENENPDSLFSKVNMVKKYNDKNQK